MIKLGLFKANVIEQTFLDNGMGVSFQLTHEGHVLLLLIVLIVIFNLLLHHGTPNVGFIIDKILVALIIIINVLALHGHLLFLN